jgi:hypothetical protein
MSLEFTVRGVDQECVIGCVTAVTKALPEGESNVPHWSRLHKNRRILPQESLRLFVGGRGLRAPNREQRHSDCDDDESDEVSLVYAPKHAVPCALT